MGITNMCHECCSNSFDERGPCEHFKDSYRKGYVDGFTKGRSISDAINSINDGLLNAVKRAYLKHHIGDESIGWDELSDTLHDALCNALGPEGYDEWLEERST